MDMQRNRLPADLFCGERRRRQRPAATGGNQTVTRPRPGVTIVNEFYDAAVSGADPIDQRTGYIRLLAWAQENDVTDNRRGRTPAASLVT